MCSALTSSIPPPIDSDGVFEISGTGLPDRWNFCEEGSVTMLRRGICSGEGCIALNNFELFDSFYGRLSPTEVSLILMHALSEDTRIIYQYVHEVFKTFSEEFDPNEDGVPISDEEETLTMLMVWKERLAALSYQVPAPPH